MDWFDRLQLLHLAPRFGLHDMLEDRRLRVVAANPARGALLRRILEMAGYEIVQSPAQHVDGLVTDGVTASDPGLPVVDVADATDVGSFLTALRSSLLPPAPAPALN